MAAKRGDEFVESKSKSENSMKHEIEVDIPETRDQANSLVNYLDANGDQSPLIDPELSDNRNETILYFSDFMSNIFIFGKQNGGTSVW